jgi:hypothetical protein
MKRLNTEFREEQRPRMIENRVINKILGPKREEVGAGINLRVWSFMESPNNTRVIKPRTMRWVENVARIGNKMYNVPVEKPEGNNAWKT